MVSVINKLEGKEFEKYKVCDLEHPGSPLVGSYAADEENSEDYDFLVHVDTNKAIVVAHYVYGHGRSGVFSKGNFFYKGYSWELQSIPEEQEKK